MTRAVVLSAVRTPVGRYGGGLAGTRPDDLDPVELSERELALGNHDRAVSLAERCAVWEQCIAVDDGRIGAGGQRCHLEAALERPLVQRLDVGNGGLQIETARVHPARLEGPDHERIVRVRAVPDPDSVHGVCHGGTLPWEA